MDGNLTMNQQPPMSEIRFDPELVARYGGRGPRYTSYPTALQFNDDFTVDHYKKRLLQSNQLTPGRPISIYVHIPFCQSLCYYCACNKVVTRNQARVRNYLASLYREITMQSALVGDSRIVDQIHFGGGTPTYLSDEQLCDLMAHLDASFNLHAGNDREFSIEIDPRTVSEQSLDILAELGFNRLSLGVQDFEPVVQQAINRIQSAKEISKLLIQARQINFKSVSFDLIYGLPHQTEESFRRTLESVVAMRPDRLAIYNYAHLPSRFKGQRMINEGDLPSPAEKLRILQGTIEQLTRASYVYVGMDHFALPDDDLVTARKNGSLHRNFQGYSTHKHSDLIGLGASAIGQIGDSISQNATTTAEYEKLIEAGKLPIRRGIVLTEDDRIRAEVIQQIMCTGRIDFADFQRRLSIEFSDYFYDELRQLAPLEEDGLVEVHTDGIQVTPIGRLLLRSISMVFDRYLAPELAGRQYSQTI